MKRLGMILLAGCLLAFVPPYPHAPTQEYVGGELLADFVGGDAPTLFDAHFETSGVDSLPGGSCGALEINGQSLSPFFCLDARDATASSWPSRVGSAVFTLTGSGDDPVQLDTAFIDGTQEVRQQNATKEYTSTDLIAATYGIDDVLIVAAISFGSGSYTINSPLDVTGALWPYKSGARMQFRSYDAAGSFILASSATSDAAVAFVVFAYDRDHASGMQIYLEGAVSGAAVNASAHSAVDFTPGSGDVRIFDFSSVGDGGVLYWAAYKGSELFNNGANDTPTQDLAAELFSRFNGTYANRADDRVPSFTRASVATIQNTTTGAVTTVPSGWPVVEADGYRPESAATNLVTNSNTRTGFTAWNTTQATSTTERAPDGTFYQELTENTATDTHGFSQNLTYAAADYVSSVHAKKIDRRWVWIRGDSGAVYCVYDLDSGVVGSSAGGVGHITPVGDGYRLEFAFTSAGAVYNIFFAQSDSDSVTSYTGDGTSKTAWWGAQLELDNGTGRASSYIPTAGSAVTRAASLLTYSHSKNMDSAIAEIDFTIDSLSGVGRYLMAYHDADTLDYAIWYLNSGNQLTSRLDSPLGNSLITDPAAVVAGASYTVRERHRTGGSVHVMRKDGATVATGTPPADSIGVQTTLRVGHSMTGVEVGDGTHVKRVRILRY